MTPLMIKEMDSAEAHEALQVTGRVQLVDVREDWEFGQGHLPGARLIPLGELPRRMHELDPSRPVFVVCAGGMRSFEAACFLTERGFPDVVSLREGTLGWLRQGFATES